MAAAAIVSAILSAIGGIMEIISAFVKADKDKAAQAEIAERITDYASGVYWFQSLRMNGYRYEAVDEKRIFDPFNKRPYVQNGSAYRDNIARWTPNFYTGPITLYLYNKSLLPVGMKSITIPVEDREKGTPAPGTYSSERERERRIYEMHLGDVNDFAAPRYPSLGRYIEKHSAELFTGDAVLCSETESKIVYGPNGWFFAPQSFYDSNGDYWLYDGNTNSVKADSEAYKSANTRYSTFYGESVRSVQDKQAVDAAQELLDEAERNSAAMRLQEISVAEQAAKDKASADRRRWILVLIGSGAIGYWIYRRYFKNKRR